MPNEAAVTKAIMLENLLEEPKRGDPSSRRYVAGEIHGEVGEGMRTCQDYGRVFGEKLSTKS